MAKPEDGGRSYESGTSSWSSVTHADDECVFEWAQKLGKKDIRDVVTVQIGRSSTTASSTLTQGVTGESRIY